MIAQHGADLFPGVLQFLVPCLNNRADFLEVLFLLSVLLLQCLCVCVCGGGGGGEEREKEGRLNPRHCKGHSV